MPPPTFNIIIATIARPSLQHMLNSLQEQLEKDDCLTLLFDGVSEKDVNINTDTLKCKVIKYYHETRLGSYGCAIREFYKNKCYKTDFVMYADDDDEYIPDSFNKLRKLCVDKDKMYIFKMSFKPIEDRYVPNELNNMISDGNIGTPNGVIPFDINNKGTWGSNINGDYMFYKSIQSITTNIEYIDVLIYQIRPHIVLSKLAEKYKLDKSITTNCHNYIPIYTELFMNCRYSVKTVLEIGIGSIENGQMSGVIKYGYKTGNSLKCWSDYFVNSKIYGIDIFNHHELNTDKITTYVADQGNSIDLDNVINKINNKLDVIIDDGSHLLEHQVFSFMYLNKHLSNNGIYVIEDIQKHNLSKFKDLSAFPSHFQEYIHKYFKYTLYEGLNDNRSDDYMIVFTRLI